MSRSLRPEVRNPILNLPAAKRLAALLRENPEVQAEFICLLRELRVDAQARGQHLWDKHKGPMAVYWYSSGVVAGHIARAVK